MSMIGLSCYILVDTYFVSKGMGENGLAALNLAIPVYSVINGIGLMLGIGGGTKYSISRAMGKKEECDHIFMNMIFVAAGISLIFVLLGIFQSERLSLLLGANEQTLEMTSSYIRTTLLFAPAFMINNIGNCFVKNDGNPKLAMAAMLSGSLFNIIFDYIFIFPLSMGMLGAALATGTAPLAGLFVLSLHFITGRNHFSFRRSSLNPEILKTCLPLGVPSLITELSSGTVIIVFNLLILGIGGNVAVAAYGIIANISLVVISIYTGIAQGMQPVISEAYGRSMKSRVKRVLRYGLITSAVLSLALYLLLFVKADFFTMVFNRDGNLELQKMAVAGIRIYFSAVLFAGFNILMASCFASVEKKIPAQIISVARGFVLIIPLAFVLSKMAGLTGIWLSFPAAEGLTALLGILCYLREKRR